MLEVGTTIAMSMDINTGQIKEYDFGKKHAGGFLSQAANGDAYFVCSNLNGINRIARYDKKTDKIIETTARNDEYMYIDADEKYVYLIVNDRSGRSNNAPNDKYVILNQKDLSIIKEIPLNNYGYGTHSFKDKNKYYFTYNTEVGLQSYLGIIDKSTLELEWVDLGETKSAMIEKSGRYLYIANVDVVEARGTKVTRFDPKTKEISSYGMDHNVSEIRADDKNLYIVDDEYYVRELYIYKYKYDKDTDTMKQEKKKKLSTSKDYDFGSFYLK